MYAFFFFFIILSGYIIQVGVTGLDTSAWSFAGSGFAKGLVPHLGLIYMVICTAGLVVVAMGKSKR